MSFHHVFEDKLKYKPDYKWPEEGSSEDCPKCSSQMELNEEKPSYYGKPWWCYKCQWQFSVEDLEDLSSSKELKTPQE